MQDNDNMESIAADEDAGQEIDFKDVPLYVEKSKTQTMPDEQDPQPKERGKRIVALDEEVSTSQQKPPSQENATPETSETEEDKPKLETSEPKKKVYKLKEENRVPQSRVNQMARQRRIVEQRYSDLYQKHQETVSYLKRLQTQGVAIPQELTAKLEQDFKALEEMENQRYESRKDEADEWLNSEVEKYTSTGFKFPGSFIREMASIIQAERLTSLDPVEAYQKAFQIWSEDNISEVEETNRADASNQSGNAMKADPKAEAAKAQAAREAAKSKATGVSKTKVTASKPKAKAENTNPHWVGDEETLF